MFNFLLIIPGTTLPNVTEPVQASPIPVISGIGNPLNEVTGIRSGY